MGSSTWSDRWLQFQAYDIFIWSLFYLVLGINMPVGHKLEMLIQDRMNKYIQVTNSDKIAWGFL